MDSPLLRKPGRPSLGPGKGRRGGRIAYRVDAETLRAAESAARAARQTVSELARAALTKALGRTS